MKLTPHQTEALDIDNHICVTAGAGSGKTTVLVDRYLNILKLREDVNPDQIAAITFTEKAAAEMKGRIIKELREPEYADIRDRHLEKMHSAPISTFHAFCSRILRENPFQAGVPANFGVLEGIEKKLLLKQTIKDTLQEIATDTEDRHREELERCLQSFTDRAQLVEMLIALVDKRDVMKHLLDTVYSGSSIERLPTEWEEAYQSVLPSETEIAEFIDCLQRIQKIARGKNVDRVEFLTSDLASLPELNASSTEVLSYLREIAKLITTTGNEIAKRDFIGLRNDTTDFEYEIEFLVSVAKRIKEAPTVDCNDVDSDDFLLLSVTSDLLTLYQRVLQEYQSVKLSQSKLDFADLQIYTRDVLKNNDKIRKKLLNQYKFYMVDEFQDTNELQYELVMLLTDELKRSNLFVVGDPKQSIYGFRDADVRVFEKTKEKIVSMGGKDIHLKENFRSLQNSVGFVNYLFAQLMGDEKENDFEVIYEPLNVGNTDNKEGVVEIILGQKDSDKADESKLLAQYIKDIVRGGVSDENSHNEQDNRDNGKPVKYGDIAILIRARRHLPDIENALHLTGIPYLTSGGIGFYQRQEIYDIWNYLNFLNAPEVNSLSLIGILRGPAFGISDNELFEISLQNGEGFWLKTQNYDKKTDRLKTAVTILKEHHKVAHRLPVNQLILTIVNQTGLIGTLKTGSKGEQRWANYQKLLDIARNFEAQENRPTLIDFIEYLDILITDEPREGDAPIEEDSDSVKIMTIHAAKGKEYPIVILPCLNRQGQGSREPFIDEKLGIGFKPLMPSQNYDQSLPEVVLLMKNIASTKDEAEKKRLLYVATTRAKNRLILSGTLKENGETENTLKMLFQLLEINKEDEYKEISDKLNFYRNGENISKNFHLKIPIIKQLEVTADDGHVDGDSVVSFPKQPIETLKPSEFNSSFTIEELANFARCQLRYQLSNVLRVLPLGEGTGAEDSSDIGNAIQRTLSHIDRRLDSVEIESRINGVLEKNPDIMNTMTETDARNTLQRHIENYLNSDIAATMLSADNSHFNQQIHARTNGHIISGRMDRLFQDTSGNWHIVNFQTVDPQNSASCTPEMQLLAYLFFSSNPSENRISITFYFIENNGYEQKHFNRTELDDIMDFWHKQIKLLQKGENRKNLEHCYICPYADSQNLCIVNDS